MTRDPQHFQFHSATEQWLSASFSHWNQLEPLWKRCLSLIPSLLNHLPRWTETPPRCGGLWFRLHRQSEKGQEDSGSLFKSGHDCRPPGAVHAKVPLLSGPLGTCLLFTDVSFIQQNTLLLPLPKSPQTSCLLQHGKTHPDQFAFGETPYYGIVSHS